MHGQLPTAVNSAAPDASSGKTEKPHCSEENTGFRGGSPEGVEASGFGKETSSWFYHVAQISSTF